MIYTEKTFTYIEALYPVSDGERRLRERAACGNVPVMRPQTAQLLRTLVAGKQPRRLLEIGTAIGYSGSVMLSACGGHLTTVEIDEKSYAEAGKNFAELGLSARVTQILGDSAEVLQALEQQYDFIFLDGAKAQYVRLLEGLIARLPSGGMLVADNVMFWGLVTGECPRVPRKRTIVSRMRQFLTSITHDARLTSCILPVADGVSVSVKK